ncbi:MAG: putative glycoside hydrolase [bacterium]|nr:putative glycoside hydrolase [bacterium]
MVKKYSKAGIIVIASGIFIAVILFSAPSKSGSPVYIKQQQTEDVLSESAAAADAIAENNEFKKAVLPPIYLPTPEPLKAIYMTSWVAGTPSLRKDLVRFIEESEANAIVIDVKDYTGRVAFDTDNEVIIQSGAIEERIPDIQALIRELNDKGIYTIARISVFQDPYFVKIRPDLAVKTLNGGVWKDRKGITWIDVSAKEYWDYIVHLSRATHAVGFDELNFDYIRFPSDGNMKDISYDYYDEAKISKAEALEQFFAYLAREIKPLGIPLSADLFGMTASNYDDLGIGQVLERAIPYFDFVSPMVYPSHYPPSFIGLANPASHPYEVIYYSMSRAVERMVAASTTPSKLRPWIQDFDLGATYDADMIRKQKQAVYDAGLSSWMAWDPSNKYTKEAYR